MSLKNENKANMAKRMWQKCLNKIIGLLMVAITLGKGNTGSRAIEKMEFSSSTQRMGLRFTEKLRDSFRKRWLRLRN